MARLIRELVGGSHPPATLNQVVFLGDLLSQRQIGTDAEITEYVENLIRLGRIGDADGSVERVLELIDYNLDMLALQQA